MEVEIAGCCGFCFGVKRAIRLAQEALSAQKTAITSGDSKGGAKKVYSLGPIIHNNQVVEELLKEGLAPVTDLSSIENGTVVVSSHGTAPGIFEQIKKKGLDCINATCPYVVSAQRIVTSLSDDDYTVVILGDRHHPEVESLVGFAKGKAIVVKDEAEVEAITLPSKKVGLVSQTTQASDHYRRIIDATLKKEFSEIRIFNTICNDTHARQRSAAQLARAVDIMIIVGGKISANTRRLFEICSQICKDTYHCETAEEVQEVWFEGKGRVGIASGASTPDWIINSIKEKILSIRGMYVQ